MSDIFAKSYATQQARESAVSTPGQPSTTDQNSNQSPTAARSADGAPNPSTNPPRTVGNPQGPVNPPVFHRLRTTELLKELEGHVESFCRGKIPKHRALFQIFVALSHCPGGSLADKDLACSHWTRELDCVE